MHYSISGRAPSFISAGLAILIAAGIHLSAASRHHGMSTEPTAAHQQAKGVDSGTHA